MEQFRQASRSSTSSCCGTHSTARCELLWALVLFCKTGVMMGQCTPWRVIIKSIRYDVKDSVLHGYECLSTWSHSTLLLSTSPSATLPFLTQHCWSLLGPLTSQGIMGALLSQPSLDPRAWSSPCHTVPLYHIPHSTSCCKGTSHLETDLLSGSSHQNTNSMTLDHLTNKTLNMVREWTSEWKG